MIKYGVYIVVGLIFLFLGFLCDFIKADQANSLLTLGSKTLTKNSNSLKEIDKKVKESKLSQQEHGGINPDGLYNG